MRMYDIIMKKRDGGILSKEEIDFFVRGYTGEDIPDYQVSALLMAIYFNGMNKEEILNLTMAMAESGNTLDLSAINGIKADKHSTGGVGDKTSLVLGPMVAALGVKMAKMSGRGLGHTGGTIDKLESFPGFSTEISTDRFIDNVNNIGLAITGQTGNLAPADKKLYALRDVTATVDNIPLIASSIMSKKLAAGADAIVLDVKTGSGAFMKTEEDAFELAKTMVDIGNGAGRNTIGVVSEMDQPLGFAVGNILEVIEAVDTLKGKGPKDLEELCIVLGTYILIATGTAKDEAEAETMLRGVIESGAALDKFKEFVAAQGGDVSMVEDMSSTLECKYVEEITAPVSGYVTHIQSDAIGLAAMVLGGGRETKESVIDLSVGIVINKKVGDYVEVGESLATMYSNDVKKSEDARKRVIAAYEFSDEKPEVKPLIKGVVK
ncbi:MAG: pyrimidine-nucleoside phosphorylase [Lachnospira sp.]|nr:pyrimidine-nucleoside phosphorylase [Lachnospira sp.]